MKALSLLLLAAPALAAAQIATDGSAGAAQVLKGPAYVVPESLGRLAGSNLFHSFSQFNLFAGESASFVLGTPGIAHVISRVTGGAPSFIDGLLRLDASKSGGAPAFWLLNPKGVLLGEGAQLDLPGAFHLSTAPQLRMADGSRWDTAGGSSFSTAAPEAFGFLGPAAAVLVQGASLDASSLQIAAGDISLIGGQLRAGGLRLAATGDWSGELPVSGSQALDLKGSLQLSHGALAGVVNTGSGEGGALQIAAGELRMTGESGLVSQTSASSSGRGGDIELRLGSLFDAREGAFVQSIAGGSGQGGSVLLQAARAFLGDGAYLWSISQGSGPGGALQLQLGQRLDLVEGGNLFSSAYAGGNGGAIGVQAPLILLDSGGLVQSESYAGGSAGSIQLHAGSQLLLQGGALVTSLAHDSGSAGALRLSSGDRLDLRGESRVSAVTTAGGNTGELSLQAAHISLDEGSRVSQQNGGGGGNLGGLRLIASGLLSLDGASLVSSFGLGHGSNGALLLQGSEIRLRGGAEVRNNAVGFDTLPGSISLLASGLISLDNAALIGSGLDGGSSGLLSLQARDIQIVGGSQISSTVDSGASSTGSIVMSASGSLHIGNASLQTSTESEVSAGKIQLSAQTLRLDDGARITSANYGGSGDGGAIELLASGSLVMDKAGLISLTTGSGQGGAVSLRAQDIGIDGDSFIYASSIESASGKAADVSLTASRQLRVGKATLDNSAFSLSGDGGRLSLSAGSELIISGGSSLSSFTAGSGRGGQIELSSGDLLRIEAGGQASVSTLASGPAGQMRLTASRIQLDGPVQLLTSALIGSSGAAGSIELSATRSIELSDAAGISSSTAGSGAAGSLRLQAPQIRLRDSLLSAAAFAGSGGQTGSVELVAGESLLAERSFITITNGATVGAPAGLLPARLLVQAPRIELRDSMLSAAALGNVDASRIELLAGERLLLERSEVSTAAQDGNGGALRVESGSLVRLRGSSLSTSVLGTRGNGGDVSLKAPVLLLDNGFIQANTAARGASGGDINLAVDALLASGNRLAVGGDTPYVFRIERDYNVIQAAAPDGINGRLNFANPVLDLSGSLVLLQGALFDPGRLARSPCERRGGSLFSVSGQGALPTPRLLGPAPTPAGRDLPGGGCP